MSKRKTPRRDNTGDGSRRSVLFLGLGKAKEGSAAQIHRFEIVRGFREAGWFVIERYGKWTNLPAVLRIAVNQMFGAASVRRADLLYLRWHVLNIGHPLLAWVLRTPYVLEVNGTDEDLVLAYPRMRVFQPLLRWLTRQQFRHASLVITVTPGLMSWASDLTHGRARTRWVPNGANLALTECRASRALPMYAVFLGEFAAWQGVDTILAARESTSWPDDVSLVFIGSGAMESAVRDAAEAGLVTYLGRLPRAEAHNVLAGAAVSLSPQTGRLARNRLGVTPLKVAESLMLGVPVIVSDLPGQADIIRRGPIGAVVPPDDPESLARAVASLRETPERLREDLAKYASDTVSWEQIAAQTVLWCAEVLER